MSKVINKVYPYEGALIWVSAPRSGVSSSTGEMWKSASFAIKFLDDKQGEQTLAFSVFGVEKVDKLLSIPLGTILHVSWRPTSRQFTNRNNETDYFSQLSVYGIATKEEADAAAAQPAEQAPAARPAQQAPAAQPQQYAGPGLDGGAEDIPF